MMGVAISGRSLLAEQRAAVHALQSLQGHHRAPRRGDSWDQPLSRSDRSRLLALAIEVLAQAARGTEAECRHIVAAAEAHAATLVQAARQDMARLTGPPPPPPPAPPPPRLPPPLPSRPHSKADSTPAGHDVAPVVPMAPRIRVAARDRGRSGGADVGTAIGFGTSFFDSFAASDRDGDPWAFMDDELVGVGPALLRRVLRRPAGPRTRPIDRTDPRP